MCDQISYGNHPDQFIRIHSPLPLEVLKKLPVIVVIHGGFWRQKYNVDNALVEHFPEFFLRCNIELSAQPSPMSSRKTYQVKTPLP